MIKTDAKYNIGQVVKHKKHPFRGVIFDIDPIFSNTEEWWHSIPEDSRPAKEQPYYHLLDDTGEPVEHPDIASLFGQFHGNYYNIEVQMN